MGSCQLHLCSDFFINNYIKNEKKIFIKFSLPFYIYDDKYPGCIGSLDYNIFNDLDYLIIENNNLDNSASSTKIINFCLNKNIKIFKTCLLKFPIFPINWSGYGENIKDYENFNGLENINYVDKFYKCLESLKKEIEKTDLKHNLIDFINNNFSKKILFTHSLHPTNILLYELWKQILFFLNIDIEKYNYDMQNELINCWHNPLTTKMVKDLKIEYDFVIDDNFYLKRYNMHINKLINKNNIFSDV